ncbi:response regulator [Blastopirellula sp. J2-11]|uniref:response regulator n=1 Tax=Blastopirellula sp. J2-11 TaxID=2943192 RepID=UPI0021C58F48|nr:response regulator [Blastopirellula sp. J2-11]UUO04409.1 response regulator [Blastopirellula sp. J2-11]
MQTDITNSQSLAGLRILIAEDDDLNRQLLEIILTGAGAEVTQVCDGDAATAIFHPDRFDLAILDLRMPRQDGITTLAGIRRLDEQFPVAALTACARREDRIACQAAGFQLFLTKPILPGDLVNALAELAEVRVVICAS